MESEKARLKVKRIINKRDAIKANNKSINLFLDILKSSQSKFDAIIIASCQAIGDVLAHLITTHKFLNTNKTSVAEEDLSKEDQFSTWLKEQFITASDILCELLEHESFNVQISSLEALIVVLQAGANLSLESAYGKLLENVMSRFLSQDHDQQSLIELLPSLLNACEGNTEITAFCLKHVKKSLKNMSQSPFDTYLLNSWRVIKGIASQDVDDKSKRVLTGVVCDFLKNKIPSSLYREILTGIPSVMEKMSSPIRLADFLSESFNIGGAISLMSLHGLFLLMHKYNLDYPDFYKKLYTMFEPQIFNAKYRARFFHLADIFLSSTHLPAYLVAAFAKRLAHMSLHASVSASNITLPFILNLISRHPACELLLHRPDGSTVDCDPFISSEGDPSKCRALESCLWELQTLEHHYNPSLSLQAKKRNIAERDLSAVLENTTSDIIASEAKKVKADVSVTFVKPNGLEFPQFFVP